MSSSKPFAQSGRVGAAGELAFRAQVLVRGHDVWMPQVDTGVDVLVGDKGVQVKTAVMNYKRRVFGFNIASRGQKRPGWECLAPEVDLVALVGVRDDEFHFWLVPCDWLRRFEFQATIGLGLAPSTSPSRRGRFSWIHDFRDAWNLLD